MRNKIERNLTEPSFRCPANELQQGYGTKYDADAGFTEWSGQASIRQVRIPTADGAAGKLGVLWRYLASDPLDEGVGQAPGVMYSK